MAHITSFTVENFKRFEHFEMQNIGQFNLIVGDNNVGKTSVLEALLVEKSAAVTRYNLLKVLTEYRGIERLRESFLRSFVRRGAWMLENTEISYDDNFKIAFIPENGHGYVWRENGIESDFDVSNDRAIKFDGTLRFDGTGIVHVPFIPFFLGYSKDLALAYSSYVQQNKETKQTILAAMRTIVPQIEDLEINVAIAEEPTIVVWQLNEKEPMSLATFGDGTLKLLRVLLNLLIHKKERLMIDEIDAGIHTSRLHQYLKSILDIASNLGVQLFMTTHNWECLEAFKEVLEEPEMQEFQTRARCFNLAQMPDGSVKSYCYDFDDFKYAIEAPFDPREVWG
ncbi:MAG: AAA family ATPase [Candidatus Kapabacteria bacterium]|jgi:AAA15 family ATPase/GTPase|nr:AAA family ATPase [Candidatus Kapabacteria bacterium]